MADRSDPYWADEENREDRAAEDQAARDNAERGHVPCWRSECGTECYYPSVCSERSKS
jgi:hypothetical protein